METVTVEDLNKKINEFYPGLAVRKDLVGLVKGNAIVPSYVLEYLLGQYCATSDEDSINAGIERVKKILAEHYVNRNEANLIKSKIKEQGRFKVIDKVSVSLNDKEDCYEATFTNLGLNKILVDSNTVKKNPKLLVSGVWSLADLEYEYTEDKRISPWVMSSLKPIQLSNFNYDEYIEARKKFSTEEWINLLIQSIGFNPELLSRRAKLIQLTRLVPFCERNYNLIELGPKGTGKSHIFSEFSPHGILISGGEVSQAKLFVNNTSGKIGLVGYWDTVAFDEFAGKQKKTDKALVDIMKNYMANKSFSRGVETIGAEASMAFVGNTSHNVAHMLKYSDLFVDLPEKFYDSAFIDRLHFYIPGWEVDIIRSELYSDGYGFVVDYLAEVLRFMRAKDYSNVYQDHFIISETVSTRDKTAINKTFSGLMKLIFPDGNATKEEIQELLNFSIEGRKRVKDQLFRIDSTYSKVEFSYTALTDSSKTFIKTAEEKEFPNYYYKSAEGITNLDDGMFTHTRDSQEASDKAESIFTTEGESNTPSKTAELHSSAEIGVSLHAQEGHFVFEENQAAKSFKDLFGAYLKGSTIIHIVDPYIRQFYQAANLMEFMEMLVLNKAPEDEIAVHLVTSQDEYKINNQESFLEQIKAACLNEGIIFTYEFDNSNKLHGRYIQSNNGWKIVLDRGLDIYQPFDSNDAFSFKRRLAEKRKFKAFYITYIKASLSKLQAQD
ncbi:MAG: BREX system Lon protease-like protein BrxL [Candidatus Melainabacteria bacterium]|nr:BREX system Lon protease-like protein BrxL [Candidatus Melainabacteria bacterium]